jgi:hypothetical protein
MVCGVGQLHMQNGSATSAPLSNAELGGFVLGDRNVARPSENAVW